MFQFHCGVEPRLACIKFGVCCFIVYCTRAVIVPVFGLLGFVVGTSFYLLVFGLLGFIQEKNSREKVIWEKI